MSSIDQQVVESRGIAQNFFYSLVKYFLDKVDIQINGNRKGDLQVKNERYYYRIFKYVTGLDRLALGESFVDGDWTSDDLILNLYKGSNSEVIYNKSFFWLGALLHSVPILTLNLQTKNQCKKDISSHYDIGNDLFKLMLDRSMNYSCGYWQKQDQLCDTLDEAQMNKMLLIGRKLHLKPGMKVLDIGCGWGYLAKFLAINYDVQVLGITISAEQIEYATKTDCKMSELEFLRVPDLKSKGTGKYEFRLMDYRDVEETFDRIVSVGMFEHVGKKNYDEFFKIARKCLKDDEGLFLLHTIGIGTHDLPQVDPWANKYIFPNGMLPYHSQIINATLGKFLIEDWHNFGFNYYRTLCAWKENFEKNWPKLEHKYDEKFRRIWIFYLCSAAILFKRRFLQCYQIVLSKKGLKDGYISYR